MVDKKRWRTLARSLEKEVAGHFPGWTGLNESDPGVTLVELFAFLAENLLYRQPPTRARARSARAARKAEALLRVNYFAGQLLGAADFIVEQDYVRNKLRRRNRWLHGSGIVSGLDVSIQRRKAGARAIVAPGFALDPRGEEIEVGSRTSLPLPASGRSLFVLVRYAEKLRSPTPGLGPDYRRVEETFDLSLAPVAGANAIALARLTRAAGRWLLDPRFRPRRARRP